MPAISCPPDFVTNQCGAVVNYSATATDNCPGVILICDPPSGSTFSNQITTVNCAATDAVGNTANCSFTVTVNSGLSITPLTSVVTCSGEAATFSTAASGSGPFSYAWTLDGN